MKNENLAPHKAVSLQYKKGKNAAPKVTAKGQGWVAENIIKMAQENNIPIRKDKDLLNLLSEIDIGQEVPESLYKIVAELLAWVYQLNQKYSAYEEEKRNES